MCCEREKKASLQTPRGEQKGAGAAVKKNSGRPFIAIADPAKAQVKKKKRKDATP